MIIFSAVLLNLFSLSCNYEGGFTKARSDLSTGSYGYNLDQYCFAESDALKTDYKKGYDRGRVNGPKLDAGGIIQNPQDESSLQSLLDLAAKKEQEAKQRAEIEALRAQLQKQNQSLDQLTTETNNLKSETSRLKEDLSRKTEDPKPAK